MSACSSKFYMQNFRWILGSIGFLIIAGCANEIEKQKNLASGNLLTVALENLNERYIEPLQPDAISINRLQKLIARDPTLNIERKNSHCAKYGWLHPSQLQVTRRDKHSRIGRPHCSTRESRTLAVLSTGSTQRGRNPQAITFGHYREHRQIFALFAT